MGGVELAERPGELREIVERRPEVLQQSATSTELNHFTPDLCCQAREKADSSMSAYPSPQLP